MKRCFSLASYGTTKGKSGGKVQSSEGEMTMMFDETIKLYAAPADDDENYIDEAEDDRDDQSLSRRYHCGSE